MTKCFVWMIAAISLLGAAVRADDDSQKTPASKPLAVSIADKQALDANMGNEVVVQGTVTDAQWSSTGKVFLIKFKEADATEFQAVIFAKSRDTMEKAFDGDLSIAFDGASVQIDGKLQTYRDHPEIPISDPKQITIFAKGPGNSSHVSATQPAAAVRLRGIYRRMDSLTDDQRAKIAAIQTEGREAELAVEKMIAAEEDKKIAALLSDDQKQQLKSLQEAATTRPSNRPGDGD